MELAGEIWLEMWHEAVARAGSDADALAHGPRFRPARPSRALKSTSTTCATRGSWLRAATALAAIAVLTAGLATACGGASGPTGLLAGEVTLGPVTPVEQMGGEPDARPYAAIIDVATPDGDVVETVESGSDGAFSVRLPAGSYRLRAAPSRRLATPVRRTLGHDRRCRQDHQRRDRVRQRHPLTTASPYATSGTSRP